MYKASLFRDKPLIYLTQDSLFWQAVTAGVFLRVSPMWVPLLMNFWTGYPRQWLNLWSSTGEPVFPATKQWPLFPNEIMGLRPAWSVSKVSLYLDPTYICSSHSNSPASQWRRRRVSCAGNPALAQTDPAQQCSRCHWRRCNPGGRCAAAALKADNKHYVWKTSCSC